MSQPDFQNSDTMDVPEIETAEMETEDNGELERIGLGKGRIHHESREVSKFIEFLYNYCDKPQKMDADLHKLLSESPYQFRIHGPCGAGKTSLLRAINGVDRFITTPENNEEELVTNIYQLLAAVKETLAGNVCKNKKCAFEFCQHPLVVFQRENFQRLGAMESKETFLETDLLDVLAYNCVWFQLAHPDGKENGNIYDLMHGLDLYSHKYNDPHQVHIFLDVPSPQILERNIMNRKRKDESLYTPAIIKEMWQTFIDMYEESSLTNTFVFEVMSTPSFL